jgi:hypothetical protein
MAGQEMELSELDTRDVYRLNVIEGTDMDLPNVSFDLDSARLQLTKTNLVSNVSRNLNVTHNINSAIYWGLNFR